MASFGSRLVSIGASAFAFSASFGAAAAATWWLLGGLGGAEGGSGRNLDADAEHQLQKLLGSLGDLEDASKHGPAAEDGVAALDAGSGDEGGDGGIRRISGERAPLAVVRASSDEASAHDEFMAMMEKQAGETVWSRLQATE